MRSSNWMSDINTGLDLLGQDFARVTDSKFARFLKVYHMIVLQRRWRLCELDKTNAEHPADVFMRLLTETRHSFRQSLETLYISTCEINPGADGSISPPPLERRVSEQDSSSKDRSLGSDRSLDDYNKQLFNMAFPATVHSAAHRRRRLETIKNLMRSSGFDKHVQGATILDIGCGFGEWMASYLELGAKHVSGIDVGCDTLRLTKEILDAEGRQGQYDLTCKSVYSIPYEARSFDIVSQIGVFTHLADVSPAIREALRVLRPSGFMVYATGGKGGIRYALQDKIRDILLDIPTDTLIEILNVMGVSSEHSFFIIDSFQAKYNRVSKPEIQDTLSGFGLHDFVYMPNELNGTDPYENEKFGDGFMKLYAQYG